MVCLLAGRTASFKPQILMNIGEILQRLVEEGRITQVGLIPPSCLRDFTIQTCDQISLYGYNEYEYVKQCYISRDIKDFDRMMMMMMISSMSLRRQISSSISGQRKK